ncbi:hypothetical protein DQ04_01281140, partial [Trypanosoma grayi]|uniref:hypothetical protein n=1 Tax=Trypanosoma grayi TaxID=71804 RepID=UPI0004F43384
CGSAAASAAGSGRGTGDNDFPLRLLLRCNVLALPKCITGGLTDSFFSNSRRRRIASSRCTCCERVSIRKRWWGCCSGISNVYRHIQRKCKRKEEKRNDL